MWLANKFFPLSAPPPSFFPAPLDQNCGLPYSSAAAFSDSGSSSMWYSALKTFAIGTFCLVRWLARTHARRHSSPVLSPSLNFFPRLQHRITEAIDHRHLIASAKRPQAPRATRVCSDLPIADRKGAQGHAAKFAIGNS